MTRFLLAAAVVLSFMPGPAWSATRPKWTMIVDIGDQRIEGTPLAWSQQQVLLLARDGRLWDFSPRESRNFRKVSSSFSSYSTSEMRAALERELRGKLVITSTGHYLVAHPKGKEAWAQRFEQLYRSCIHYFGMREMRVTEPAFPLVAVVWGNRADFERYAAEQGSPVRDGVLGYYSPTSNRVMLYDQDWGNRRLSSLFNDSTIIHEATHQIAFNTGVHNRFSPTPSWLAEGLGSMFEATGVWDWQRYPDRRDRVNRLRLIEFRMWQKSGRAAGNFAQLLASDRQFSTNPTVSYAEAWAWVFFLTERYPRKFADYVRRVSAREDFGAYSTAERINDFSAVFGSDLRMLEKHCLNFISEL